MSSRYVIALVLGCLAAFAISLAFISNIWLIPAAFPPAVGACACLAPRGWLSSEKYRSGMNIVAYLCVIPAAIALAAAVGMTLLAVLVLPALFTFVFVTWKVKSPALD